MHGNLCREELNRVRVLLYYFPGYIKSIASVVFEVWFNVPDVNAMCHPPSADCGIFVDEYLGPWWGKGSFVEVKCSIQL